VKIHVLVDGMSALKFGRQDRERRRAAGVQLYPYGRRHWWKIEPNINQRTLLVVDGRIGFTSRARRSLRSRSTSSSSTGCAG